MLAAAGVGYLLLKPSNDTSEAAETLPATPTTSASSTAPAGNTVTHKSGKFSVVLPANGWQTKSDGDSQIAAGAPVIQFAPDLTVYNKGSGRVVGFAIVYLTGSQTSPEKYVSGTQQSASSFGDCQWSKPKVFEYKDFKGTFADRKACTTKSSDGASFDFDQIQLGVSRADGTQVGMVIRDAPNETSTRMLALAALESIKKG